MIPQLHLSKTTYNCHLVHEAFDFVGKNDMNKLYPDLSIKSIKTWLYVSGQERHAAHKCVIYRNR